MSKGKNVETIYLEYKGEGEGEGESDDEDDDEG